MDTIVWDPHDTSVACNAADSGPQVNREFEKGSDQAADTEAVVLACYEFYGVQHPYWSPTYQRPNWR